MGHKILNGKAEMNLIRACIECGPQKAEKLETHKRNEYDQNTLYACMIA